MYHSGRDVRSLGLNIDSRDDIRHAAAGIIQRGWCLGRPKAGRRRRRGRNCPLREHPGLPWVVLRFARAAPSVHELPENRLSKKRLQIGGYSLRLCVLLCLWGFPS